MEKRSLMRIMLRHVLSINATQATVSLIRWEQITKEADDCSSDLCKDGMLYFFQSPFNIDNHYYDFGKVIYSDNMNLVRKNLSTINKDMILNYSLKDICNIKEKFSDRYYEDEGRTIYSGFKNQELNKIYGFYTDCQMQEEEIKKVSKKYIVLLQIGSELYGEGVTTFLITEEDLKNKNFNNIIYKYVQS